MHTIQNAIDMKFVLNKCKYGGKDEDSNDGGDDDDDDDVFTAMQKW